MYISSSLAIFLIFVVSTTEGGQPGLRGGGRTDTTTDGEIMPIEADTSFLVPGDDRMKQQDQAEIFPPVDVSPDIKGYIIYDDEKEQDDQPTTSTTTTTTLSMKDSSYNLRSNTPPSTALRSAATARSAAIVEDRTLSEGNNTNDPDEKIIMDPADILWGRAGDITMEDETTKKTMKTAGAQQQKATKKRMEKRQKSKEQRGSTVEGNNASEGEEEPQLFFQGDIIPDYDLIMNDYGPDTLQKLEEAGVQIEPSKLSGVATKNLELNRRWSTRVGDVVQIPFVISSSFNGEHQQLIQKALADIARRSGIVSFIPRSSEADYINVVNGAGCSSYVGKVGGAQELSLNIPSGCVDNSVVQHEFLHALGFQHEQSRPDRDSFVTINYENIQPGLESAFDKQTSSESLGSAYDYASVMHYGATFFSKNGQKTIEAPQPIGQRVGADAEDIFQVQLLYQCVSGARKVAEFRSKPCTQDCKCWESALGCNGDDGACLGNLVCSNNQCVQPGSGGGGGGGGDGSGGDGGDGETYFLEVRNKENSNLCLDVRNGDTRNGNAILLSPCNGSQSQKFLVDESGRIMSAINLNKCLVGDSGNTSRGTRMWIHDCFADDSRFQFFFYTNGRIRPQGDITQCVGPSRSRTVDGKAVVQFWTCSGEHQKWIWNWV